MKPGRGAAANRRLAINFFLLSGGEFVAKLLTFAAFAYLARVLGASSYGTLEFVLAVMVFFTLPADLGLGAYGAREIARYPGRAFELLTEISHLRLVLAAGSFALLLLFAAIVPKPLEVRLLLSVYGLTLLLGPALLQWFFQAHDLMHWVALASIIRQAVFAGLLIAFFGPETPLVAIGFAELASVLAVAVYCSLIVRYRLGVPLPGPSIAFARLRTHLREGLPIGLTEMAWAFMWYFATVMLGLIFHDEELGWFGASHRVLMALHTFVWLYFFNLLPSISRCVPQGHKRLVELLGKSTRFVAWTSLFGAFAMTVFAREALIMAYGPGFAGATRCLAVLMWVLPVAMLSGHYRYTLIAYNLQTRLFYCTVIAAAVAVAAGLALVPFFGATGAAVALLLANVVIFVLAYRAVRERVTAIPLAEYLVSPILGLALATGVYSLFSEASVWLAGAVSMASYLLVLALFDGRRMVPALRALWARHPMQEQPAPAAGRPEVPV